MREKRFEALKTDRIVRAAMEVAARHHTKVYVVGGTLRDLVLDKTPRDWDFVSEHPFEAASDLAEKLGSKIVSLGKEAKATYRIPLDGTYVDWVGLPPDGIDRDLMRRDFTINSIAFDPGTSDVRDPAGGLQDLERGVIRLTSLEAFGEDPLRIVKAFRMLAQFPSFELEPETLSLASEQSGGLIDVPVERIQVEMDRLLSLESPGRVMRLASRCGVLSLIFPELKPLDGLGQNSYHHTDVLDHTLEALESLDGPPEWLSELSLPDFSPDEWVTLRLAVLYHDSGKAATRSVGADGRVHFYGHPRASSELARTALTRLRFPNARVEAVADLCLNHLRPLGLIKTCPRKTALRRLVHSMDKRLPLLIALSYADKGASRGRDHDKNIRDLKSLGREVMALAAAEGEALRRLPKLVNGLEALEILGLAKPGPELGRALDSLLEQQVAGNVTTRSEAEAYLASLGGRRSSKGLEE